MTIVFTVASPSLIVMAADSAVTVEIGNSREYEVGRKSYFFPGVGCVMTWGARDHNLIGPFLDRHGVSPRSHTVASLADLVYDFLVHNYRPAELALDDVGYHVAGFDEQHQPRLWHIFYGYDRPRPPGQVDRKYERYDHTPAPGTTYFLYNGRNDLADPVVRTLLAQIASGAQTRFNLGSPPDVACFADFVTRFAAEFTPEVGPPFITYLIDGNNHALSIINHALSPIDRGVVLQRLRELGYRGE